MGVNRVHVQIDELVLDGFAAADRVPIAEGVRQELARLIGAQDLAHFGEMQTRVGSLDAGSFAVTPGADAGSIGRGVARSVTQGLTKGGRRE
jgi:hypothetical protein